ncbi:MAG: hypothetical protein ACOCRK_01260 [bacterium]
MARDISQSFLNKLQAKTSKTRLTAYIDWDNDGFDSNDLLDNYIQSATIDKKVEGNSENIGVGVVDKATLTLDNINNDFSPKNMNGKWSGNIIPSRDGVIYGGIENDTLNIFDGVVTDIIPNYNNSKVTIKMDDYVKVFQNTNCPDEFYVDKRAENIIKEWIDSVNDKYDLSIDYSDETIDNTTTSINYNFNGQKMWDAMNYIAQSLSGEIYIDNKMFYFQTPISSEHQTNQEVVCEFIADPDHESTDGLLYVDSFKIKEEYSSKEIYNEVEISSEPYRLQSKQQIWTGFENEVENTEEYNSNDIVDNTLQLTYVPEGETTEQPTKNIPVTAGSVIDISNGGLEYTIENGGLSDISDTGVFTFGDTASYPTPEPDHILQVKYRHLMNKLLPGKEKQFFINLENPAINIDDLYILPMDTNQNKLPYSFTSSTDVVYIQQEVLSNKQRVKINITNNTFETAILYGNLNGNPVDNLYLMGQPFKRTNNFNIVKADETSSSTFKFTNRLSISNDLITQDKKIKKMTQYLLSKYAYPYSILEVEVRGLPHLEMNDRVRVVQKDRDIDDEFLIKGIKHKFSKGTWYTTYKLEQADASEWTYTEDGTLVFSAALENRYDNPEVIPTDVTGFDARIINDNVILRGDKVPFASSYRIKIGNSWETATQLTEVTKTNYYNVGTLPANDWTFWIKAVSEHEKSSTNASSTELEVFEFRDANIVEVFNDDFSEGEHDNTTRFEKNEIISLATSNKNNSSSTTDYFPCELQGTYLSPVFDTGQITKSRVYPNINIFPRSSDLKWENYDMTWLEFADNDYTKSWLELIEVGDIQINLKYSEDDVSWKTVKNFIIADVKARYYQLEIIFNNDTQWGNFAVEPYVLTVDVPDIIDKGTAFVDGTGTINFNKSFYDIKSITATPINTGSTNGINYEITNYDNESFTIKVSDNSDNPISTDIFWEVVGY